MEPTRVSFTFFGPSEGLEFHTIPSPESSAFYNPPAIASVYELAVQGAALMVARVVSPETGTPMTWIGSYAQIFEKGLDRRGHSFGVGIWFSSEIPCEIDLIIRALNTLKQALAQRCVSDGRFCDRAQFLDFVKYFEPKVTGFREQMFPRWEAANYGTGLSIKPGETAFQIVSGIDDEPALTRLLAWCIWAPGGTAFQKVIIAERSSGEPSDGIKLSNDLERRSGNVYLEIVGRFSKLQAQFNGAVAKTEKERDQFRSVAEELTVKNRQLENENGVLRDKLQQVPAMHVPRANPTTDNLRRAGGVINQYEADASNERNTSTLLAVTNRVEHELSNLKRSQNAEFYEMSNKFFWTTLVAGLFLLMFSVLGVIAVFKIWNFEGETQEAKNRIRQMNESIKPLIEEVKRIGERGALKSSLGQEDATSPSQVGKPQSQKLQNQGGQPSKGSNKTEMR